MGIELSYILNPANACYFIEVSDNNYNHKVEISDLGKGDYYLIVDARVYNIDTSGRDSKTGKLIFRDSINQFLLDDPVEILLEFFGGESFEKRTYQTDKKLFESMGRGEEFEIFMNNFSVGLISLIYGGE